MNWIKISSRKIVSGCIVDVLDLIIIIMYFYVEISNFLIHNSIFLMLRQISIF